MHSTKLPSGTEGRIAEGIDKNTENTPVSQTQATSSEDGYRTFPFDCPDKMPNPPTVGGAIHLGTDSSSSEIHSPTSTIPTQTNDTSGSACSSGSYVKATPDRSEALRLFPTTSQCCTEGSDVQYGPYPETDIQEL